MNTKRTSVSSFFKYLSFFTVINTANSFLDEVISIVSGFWLPCLSFSRWVTLQYFIIPNYYIFLLFETFNFGWYVVKLGETNLLYLFIYFIIIFFLRKWTCEQRRFQTRPSKKGYAVEKDTAEDTAEDNEVEDPNEDDKEDPAGDNEEEDEDGKDELNENDGENDVEEEDESMPAEEHNDSIKNGNKSDAEKKPGMFYSISQNCSLF